MNYRIENAKSSAVSATDIDEETQPRPAVRQTEPVSVSRRIRNEETPSATDQRSIIRKKSRRSPE